MGGPPARGGLAPRRAAGDPAACAAGGPPAWEASRSRAGHPRPMPRAPAGSARPCRRRATRPRAAQRDRRAGRRGATRRGAARPAAGGPGSPCHTRGRRTPRHPFCLGRPITAAGGVFVACRATPRDPGGRNRARRQETWRGMHRATGHGASAPATGHRAPGAGTGRRAPGTGHRAPATGAGRRAPGMGPGRHPGPAQTLGCVRPPGAARGPDKRPIRRE